MNLLSWRRGRGGRWPRQGAHALCCTRHGGLDRESAEPWLDDIRRPATEDTAMDRSVAKATASGRSAVEVIVAAECLVRSPSVTARASTSPLASRE
ncbi:hypothetical protein E2562_003190 [Oryza meyeriana var. granulata]|uniref:Uncharacterized protein n=1 Tax=Oryza meyeriana var. granulata TaxID=110450 RepID=A0A6G1EUQ1_9ORYZ|nr:hypothetical protein E2562_003190 [Oryza meyeriana var. granulata]